MKLEYSKKIKCFTSNAKAAESYMLKLHQKLKREAIIEAKRQIEEELLGDRLTGPSTSEAAYKAYKTPLNKHE